MKKGEKFDDVGEGGNSWKGAPVHGPLGVLSLVLRRLPGKPADGRQKLRRSGVGQWLIQDHLIRVSYKLMKQP